MKIEELEIGTIFNIEDTPSYPKLKIEGGYVDMRDEIVNKSGNCNEKKVTVMTIEDLKKQFGSDGLVEWIAKAMDRYI